jgi:hypothetical protein
MSARSVSVEAWTAAASKAASDARAAEGPLGHHLKTGHAGPKIPHRRLEDQVAVGQDARRPFGPAGVDDTEGPAGDGDGHQDGPEQDNGPVRQVLLDLGLGPSDSSCEKALTSATSTVAGGTLSDDVLSGPTFGSTWWG